MYEYEYTPDADRPANVIMVGEIYHDNRFYQSIEYTKTTNLVKTPVYQFLCNVTTYSSAAFNNSASDGENWWLVISIVITIQRRLLACCLSRSNVLKGKLVDLG